ncbi:hypothetical protein [Aeromonas veronii]|uniref:hypothetical protein n=1 Tax=Aeromonas veronii TaxID=654 RepID=UPI0011174989|nr:hypothetical protein [Aeromonas veronii]
MTNNGEAMFFDYDRNITIHHYDSEDYYYIGSENYLQIKGTGLPFSATDIALPDEKCEDGWIYVFNGSGWIKKEDKYKKPNLIEFNYIHYDPLPTHFMKSYIEDPIQFMPPYKGIKKFSNPIRQSLLMATKFSVVQDDFFDLLQLHRTVENEMNNPSLKPYYENTFVKFRLKTEGLILSIRTILDELTQLSFILAYNEEFESNLKLEVDNVGALFDDKRMGKYGICRDLIFGNESEYDQDKTSFISTLNDLFNSIKHSHLHHESQGTFSKTPNVVSLYVKKNNFSKYEIIYHNHNLFQIMYGFIDNFCRIINNQRKFCE